VHVTIRALVIGPVLAAAAAASPQSDADAGNRLAAAVGDAVQAYLSVARSIVTREEVRLQPLTEALSDTGPARRFTYESRVEWEPGTDGLAREATVHRELRQIDGRRPRPAELDGCLPPTWTDPLAFLLPGERAKYEFRAPPGERGRRERVLEYAPRAPGTPSLQWRGDCGSIELPGILRGRLVVDADTFAAVRLEQRLDRMVRVPVPPEDRKQGWGDTMVVERLDVTIRYAAVQFRNPDERVTLPVEMRRVVLVRTPQARALRVEQRYSDHRRFVTSVRVGPAR
jgi:hypothetical protein